MAKTTKKASAKKATPTKATKSSPAPEARIAREVLPMPDLKHVGLTRMMQKTRTPNTPLSQRYGLRWAHRTS